MKNNIFVKSNTLKFVVPRFNQTGNSKEHGSKTNLTFDAIINISQDRLLFDFQIL